MKLSTWGRVRLGAIVLALVAIAAAPLFGQQTTAGSRVEWDQPASTEADLPLLTYRAFIDNAAAGVALVGVTCGSLKNATGYVCSAAWPASTPGKHTLQLASYKTINGAEVRSVELSNVLAFEMILAPGTPQNIRIAAVSPPAEENPALADIAAFLL